jgi:hypothetical protein
MCGFSGSSLTSPPLLLSTAPTAFARKIVLVTVTPEKASLPYAPQSHPVLLQGGSSPKRQRSADQNLVFIIKYRPGAQCFVKAAHCPHRGKARNMPRCPNNIQAFRAHLPTNKRSEKTQTWTLPLLVLCNPSYHEPSVAKIAVSTNGDIN